MEPKIMIFIVAILVIILVIEYNIIQRKQNNIKNAYGTLDVMLKKRYDLIPSLVNCVKGYMEHEKSTLEMITKLRNRVDSVKNKEEIFDINNYFHESLQKINILAESYPDLKANENFMYLQKVLYDVEENISASRRTYNAHVTDYNNFIMMIPNNLFAKIFGFKQMPLFSISKNERKGKIWYNEK